MSRLSQSSQVSRLGTTRSVAVLSHVFIVLSILFFGLFKVSLFFGCFIPNREYVLCKTVVYSICDRLSGCYSKFVYRLLNVNRCF